MDVDEIKFILRDQSNIFRSTNKGTKRILFDSLDKSTASQLQKVYVITGPRRAGKSTLLRQFAEKKNYLYLDFSDERLADLKTDDLNKILEAGFQINPKFKFIFFDEIKFIKGQNRFLNRLIKMGYKVYITGSNSNLLSNEINTYLTGRHIDFGLFPFSFKEYLIFKKISKDIRSTKDLANIKNAFSTYLKMGGFPEIIQDNKLHLINAYFEDILYKDILGRWSIKNIKALKETYSYLIKNIGNYTTYNTLAEYVGVDMQTIKNYVEYGIKAYLFFIVEQFTHSPRQTKYPKKIYVIDNAYSSFFKTIDPLDNGHFLENAVAIELKRRGYLINVFKKKYECDFLVINKGNEKILQTIQVTYKLHEQNKDREIKGLLEAMKYFKLKEGLLLTYDQEDEMKIKDKDGKTRKIIVKPVWKWLLE